jgi:hypothetical protein
VNTIFFSAIATVAITTATVQPSLAQDQSAADAPVSIASCQVVADYEPVASGDSNFPGSPTGASVWVSFQNHSQRTLTDVTFLLETRDGAVTITDKGRFSSGVPIRHTLGPFADLQGDETCSLYSAQFDDGLVWQRP